MGPDLNDEIKVWATLGDYAGLLGGRVMFGNCAAADGAITDEGERGSLRIAGLRRSVDWRLWVSIVSVHRWT